jgi:hypothetical protein
MESVQRVRAALLEGDLGVALARLDHAGELDARTYPVRTVAAEVLEALLTRADAAVADEDWEAADADLELAWELCRRFALDPDPVAERIRLLGRIPWVKRVPPSATVALEMLVDTPVTLALRTGDELSGRLSAVDAATITLEARHEVGGGEVSYTDSIPVSDVIEVRYVVEPDLSVKLPD